MRRLWTSLSLTAAVAACDPSGPAPGRSPAEAPPAPVLTVPAPVLPTPANPTPIAAQGAGAAAGGADKLKTWQAVHALISTGIAQARAVSGTEAIALTSDNLVGVTKDGGSTWTWQRPQNGTVTAIAGAAGGPFAIVGRAGFAAFSPDGKAWTDLPRFADEDLVAVAADTANGIVALTRGGAWIHYGADGKNGVTGAFPDNAKPRALVLQGGQFVATGAGKTNYGAIDGVAWNALAPAPTAAALRAFPTSQGACALGRVEKLTGVVCEVKGQAYGLSDTVTVVNAKGVVFTTSDGGGSWHAALPPIASVNGVVAAGTSIVAYGNNGAVAVSADAGTTWTVAQTGTTKGLKTAFVEGANVLLAGDGGTILRSADSGATWALATTPATTGVKQLANVGGKLVASLGAKGWESADGGASWTEMLDPAPLATLVPPAKAGKCEARQPAAGEVCSYSKLVTSPTGLPNARGLWMQGDQGIAWGDYGLALMTADGGKSWKVASGLGSRGVSTFDVGGQIVAGTTGRYWIASTDAGQTFRIGELPKNSGTPYMTRVGKDGTAWIVGSNGTVLRWNGTGFDPVDVVQNGKKVTTSFVAIQEAGGAGEAGANLYLSGPRGELFRSEDKAASWTKVPTGVTQPIQRVAADGDNVVAVTLSERSGGNLLLKSEDGGKHVAIVREVSHAGGVDVLKLEGGALTYRDRTSNDFGASWNKLSDKYWNEAIDLGDGSGVRLVNFDSRYTRDTIYLAGGEKDDFVILDAIQTRLARFACSKDSGCWMLYGGEVYRPL